MKETFLDSGDQILRFKSHRDLQVRKMVITMIPSLAAYDTQTFTEHFLHKAMAHLLTQLEKPNERTFGMFYKFVHLCTTLPRFFQRLLRLGTLLRLLGAI